MNLATRLFITFALLIAFAVALAIGLTYWLGRNAVDTQIDNAFRSSQSVQKYFLDQEMRELELVSELIASDRAFVAYVTQALSVDDGQTIDTRSISDLLNERSDEYGFDFALILSPDGRTQVETGTVVPVGSDLSSRKAIATALESVQPESGLWVEPDRVLQVAIVPLISGFTVQGYLVTGTVVTSNFMSTLAQVSGIELAYVSLNNQQISIATTTLPMMESETLSELLSANDSLVQTLQSGGMVDPIAIDLSGLSWIAHISLLDDSQSNSLLVSLVPRAQLFKTFQDISKVLLISGIAAILLALIVSILAARGILRPVKSVTEVAQEATQGQYRNQLDVTGTGELRSLQRAFNHLISELREQQAAETYFEDLWQKYTITDRDSIKLNTNNNDSGMQALPDGKVLGNRYEILRMVGKGGMGLVYEALDNELNEVVALKTLKPELASDIEKVSRLKSEIRMARRITHPNVVRTHDFALVDGVPLISMEYVRGINLEDAIRQNGRINRYACVRFAMQICDGVAAAHKAGVLHRDLKPGNIMITHMAKVMDFGIAHQKQGVNASGQAIDKQTFEGTATYLSPEQLQGKNVDERSDIYAMGILFTQMFTGQIPHTSTDTGEIFKSHLNQGMRLPSEIWPNIPPKLEAVILQCLEKSPDDRWQSVEELRAALNELRLSA